jgi:DNA polymerase
MNRSAIFLNEMGVGPQWRLRDAPPAAFSDAPDEPQGQEQTWEQAVASISAGAAPVVVAAQPEEAVEAIQAATEPVAATMIEAAAPAAPAAPATPPAPTQAVTAPAPTQAVPAPVATPAVAPIAARPPVSADDASTAWFDDAPAAPAAVVPVTRGPVSEPGIADMDWTALQAAVKSCTRCDLCHSRKAAVPGRGDANAQWLVLGTAPTAADEDQQRSIAADPGQLLDNMLKAIGVTTDEDAYVTTLVKCRPTTADGADRLPTADELSACRPYLERELELAGTRIILTLGHTAGKGLLGGAARGKVLRYDGIPTIATYHPADLLRKPEDKAKAWSDLCLAKAAHAGRA